MIHYITSLAVNIYLDLLINYGTLTYLDCAWLVSLR